VIAVDSSVLVAILRREPEAVEFLHHLARAELCLLSAVSLLETCMVLAGRSGNSDTWTELDALLALAGIEVVPHDRALTAIARQAFLRYVSARSRTCCGAAAAV